MNQLATKNQLSTFGLSEPEPLPEKVARFLALAQNVIDRRNLKHYLPEGCAPSETQRAWLDCRERDIAALLEPATEAVVNGAVGKMALVLPSAGSDDPAAQDARLAIYREVLAGKVGAWALSQATDRFISGDLGDGAWLPKPGEILRAAKTIEQRWIDERALILRILHAEILPSPNQGRAEQVGEVIASGVREMSPATRSSLDAFRREVAESRLAEAGRAREGWRAPTQAEAEAWVAAHEGVKIEAPKLSSAAIKTLR